MTPSANSPGGKWLTANGYGASTVPGSSGSGETSSGGMGFGLPATKGNQSQRMARTASAANFMALFGPQTQGA